MSTIIELLAHRHKDDVFVAECNTGSAHAGCRRMDAWVLRKTWTPWTAIGYEVKEERSDFLRDSKWPDYLPFCNELYWVCPHGLIKQAEVPENTGLIYVTRLGSRLLTKVKAPRRTADPAKLIKLMSYVLMSRSRIVADMHEASDDHDPVAFWRGWLRDKLEKRQMGHEVSRRITQEYKRMKQEVQAANRIVESYKTARARLRELGIDPTVPVDSWVFNNELEKLRNGIPRGLLESTVAAAKHFQRAMEEVAHALREPENDERS